MYVVNVGMSGLPDVLPEGRRLTYQSDHEACVTTFIALMQQSPQHLSNN